MLLQLRLAPEPVDNRGDHRKLPRDAGVDNLLVLLPHHVLRGQREGEGKQEGGGKGSAKGSAKAETSQKTPEASVAVGNVGRQVMNHVHPETTEKGADEWTRTSRQTCSALAIWVRRTSPRRSMILSRDPVASAVIKISATNAESWEYGNRAGQGRAGQGGIRHDPLQVQTHSWEGPHPKTRGAHAYVFSRRWSGRGIDTDADLPTRRSPAAKQRVLSGKAVGNHDVDIVKLQARCRG